MKCSLFSEIVSLKHKFAYVTHWSHSKFNLQLGPLILSNLLSAVPSLLPRQKKMAFT